MRWNDRLATVEEPGSFAESVPAAVLTSGVTLAMAIPPSVSEDGPDVILTGGFDGNVQVFETFEQKVLFQRHHEGPVRALAVAANGTRFVTVAGDNTARVFSAQPPHLWRELAYFPFDGPVERVALSVEGKYLIIEGRDDQLHLFDVNTRAEISRRDSFSYYTPVLASTFNKKILALAESSIVKFLTIPELRQVDLLRGVGGNGICWAPGENFVAILDPNYFYPRKIALWNIDKTEPDEILETASDIQAFAFSLDAKLLAVGTKMGALIFDRTTRKFIFHGPQEPVNSVSFLSDHKLVTGGLKAAIFKIR